MKLKFIYRLHWEKLVKLTWVMLVRVNEKITVSWISNTRFLGFEIPKTLRIQRKQTLLNPLALVPSFGILQCHTYLKKAVKSVTRDSQALTCML